MFNFFAKRHKWEYRNPYARKCKKCGRIENFYQTGANHWQGELEEMYPLATNKTAKCYVESEY